MVLVLYVGCVSRPNCGRVCPLSTVLNSCLVQCCIGVCGASHLWACVCPLSTVLVCAWFLVLYVGCVLRPICGCVCPLSTVLVCAWFLVLYVGCVLRPICGRVCPRPLYNWVFSAVPGVCVTSHLWAFVCPPSTV